MHEVENTCVRVLCSKLLLHTNEKEPGRGSGLRWLIGSPFFPQLTIVSTIRCIHTNSAIGSTSPDFEKEADDLRTLIPRGFEVCGALTIADSDSEKSGREGIDAVLKLRKNLYGEENLPAQTLTGAVADSNNGEIRFFVLNSEDTSKLVSVASIVYEDQPEKFVWERGCLLLCELQIKFPVYYSPNKPSDIEKAYLRTSEAVISKLKDPKVVYVVETSSQTSTDVPAPVIVRGSDMEFHSDLRSLADSATETNPKLSGCGQFSGKKTDLQLSPENADLIQVSVLFSSSEKSTTPTAPVAKYIPALEEVSVSIVQIQLEVLCYAAKDLPVIHALSNVVIPGLIDQLNSMKNAILPNLLTRHPQLHPYHFCPPGFLHPVTVFYELTYGETEMQQVEFRKSLHLRLGLPYDRPLLRIANALNLSKFKDIGDDTVQKGTYLLKDVHVGIPTSGVSGGVASLVQGSYEYHHYLQDGFNDSGWGCAYRSLQTIISWFRLQHYASIKVPSHKEIQQTLVDIGDKDPSFVGSREWIGAIELSFVLDKLLGVSCKIINVRSGAELPEKCRELALHFETQGTPVMIGGGVLAYTILGVDYNDASGDCAFLILDPHYTGTDEHKRIVNGGWCGWKKAVDSKGKSFFLHDKFYNLLLPQRPNMV